MKILKYKKLKNKYRVYFENGIELDLYESIILKYNFLIKKDVDESLLNDIKKDNEKEDLINTSINYIAKKMRSKKEMYLYLLKKEYNKEDIDNTINRLIELNLINDELYAKSYINDKIRLSSDGPLKIRLSLINEGIDEEIINKYLNDIDDNIIEDKLEKMIDKKIKSSNNLSGNVLKSKLLMYFSNLGYDRDLIIEILNKKDFSNIEKGIKEYNKLINKYKNKYDEYQLERLVRQKLYLKGYDFDEIKRSINN